MMKKHMKNNFKRPGENVPQKVKHQRMSVEDDADHFEENEMGNIINE